MYWVHFVLFPPLLTGPLSLFPRPPLGHPLVLTAAGKISLQLSVKTSEASRNVIVIYFPPLNSSGWKTHTHCSKWQGEGSQNYLVTHTEPRIDNYCHSLLAQERKQGSGWVLVNQKPTDKRGRRGLCFLPAAPSLPTPTHLHAKFPEK